MKSLCECRFLSCISDWSRQVSQRFGDSWPQSLTLILPSLSYWLPAVQHYWFKWSNSCQPCVKNSILNSWITLWCGSCLKSATGGKNYQCNQGRQTVSGKNPTRPPHSVLTAIPSGRRLGTIKAKTTQLKSCFIQQAVKTAQ